MNLADAIRQAAIFRTNDAGPRPEDFFESHVAPQPDGPQAEVKPPKPVTPVPEAEADTFPRFAADSFEAAEAPEAPAPFIGAGSAVRLELFLQPDQLNALLRNVVSSQHHVMTLRETSSFLRVPQEALEEMASNGEIPAFELDGKWRFPRPGVEEWLMMRSMKRAKGA